MTTTYSKHRLSGYPLITKKRKAINAKAWGRPTGEELAALLDSIQATLEGPTARRCEAVALLSDSHAMLLRCQSALPVATETLRSEEVAA